MVGPVPGRSEQVTCVAHVVDGEGEEDLLQVLLPFQHLRELRVVPAARGECLLEDGRVRGHADDGVVADQPLELAEVAASLEALAQLAVVVDLAVDDRGHAAVLGVERLIAARDVDDGQPGVGQRERPDAPQRVAIRTAVAQRLDHPLGRVLARTCRPDRGLLRCRTRRG